MGGYRSRHYGEKGGVSLAHTSNSTPAPLLVMNKHNPRDISFLSHSRITQIVLAVDGSGWTIDCAGYSIFVPRNSVNSFMRDAHTAIYPAMRTPVARDNIVSIFAVFGRELQVNP